jgi:tetratricopeptide (TPR) repeat protein
MRRPLSVLILVLAAPFTLADEHAGSAAGGKAPLFDNLGKHHHPVTTNSKEAQRYFDQGLTLCYAFNHNEAIRSFEEAAKLDPECAMAQWGISFALGANINMPMHPDAVPKAYAALVKAQELAGKAGKNEQAYIEALAKRYAENPPKDRAPLDKSFAEAMRELAKQFPDDLDAATLFAEALMDTMPWNYWNADGTPKPETTEIIATLESVMKRDPNHPGANHYYIHAVEASPDPARGLPAAHRLRDLLPGAGHLVHMPSHIYLRLGMYHEASACNERAIAADAAYIERYKVKGMYPAMYFAHNKHFLWYSAGLEGRSADSLRWGRLATEGLTKEVIQLMPMTQWIKATPMLGLLRFGRWEEVLAEPKPDADWLYVTAIWHYSRGLALVRLGRAPEATREANALDKLVQDPAAEKLQLPNFPGASLMQLARVVLAAEVAGAGGDPDARRRGLEEAVTLEDKIPYMEPAFWYFPTRQLLGAALVENRKFAEAEQVYREDLKRHPANGWSLFGLLQCLRAQGKPSADVETRFREAWKHADLTLTASCF